MSKKRIIAIVTIIVLLFVAGISVGVFLYSRGTTQAADGNQENEQNQVADGNQEIEGTLADGKNPITQQETGDEEITPPDDGTVDGANDNENANNEVTNNNAGNANNQATNNNGVTTDTNVDEVEETTITRVEEQERLISKDFWDWWHPMTVAVKPTEVGVKIPQISVKKAAITQVGDGKLVYIGQDITYVIAVTNNSETPVENIEITDKIPENTTYVADSIEDAIILRDVDGELASEVVGTKTTVEAESKVVGVKWVVSIPAGETAIARFTVNINKTMLDENEEEIETTGTILNTAIANGEESNEVQTSIIRAHKSSVVVRDGNVVDSKTAKVGDKITYTISVENTGDVEGTTYIIDNVPAGTTFISAQEGAKVTESVDTSIIWSVTIPAHTLITREFTVEVTSVERLIKNIADVGGTPTNEDIIDTANIDVIKTATAVKRDGEDEFITPVGEVKENDTIQYTIVVTNTGSRDLTNVLLEEQLEGVEVTKLVVDDIEKAIVKDAKTGKLIIGDLKAAKEATEESEAVEAGVATITATYTVSYKKDIKDKGNEDGSTTPIYNKVYATGETIPNPENPDEVPEEVEDNDDEIVPVAEEPRFEITKTATRVKRDGTTDYIAPIGKVRSGDVVEYEIVVTNTGNTTLTNILVTDTLSVRVDTDDGELKEIEIKVDEVGNQVTVPATLKTIESLPSGKSETIKTYYTVKITDVTSDENPIYNVATAKPDECNEKKDDENVPVNPNVSIQGTKTWTDNNDKYGKRPSSITVNLLAYGTKIDSTTVTPDANGKWSYKFENKPKYENGKTITYTIMEEEITDYTPIYTTSTEKNGDVTVNIENKFSQDIKGEIITVEETELPLDVVFVLDISSSMLETDGDSTTRVEDMVKATNLAIKELMENANNRVSVVLFNSDVYELTDVNKLKHYNSTGDYITYKTVTNDSNVGGKITFSNGKTVDVSTSYYGNGNKNNGAFKCGTYTQGGIKKATQIFEKSADSTIRKPVMILLTDGDPTHYDTKTTYNEYGTKYPGGDGIGRLRYVKAEYYSYTMKTMENCKTAIKGFYNKECEMYTVGINMNGAMAKALLEPNSTNISKLKNTTDISEDIFNTDDNGNKSSLSVVDSDGVWRSGADYYKYQANRLYNLIKSSSNYINNAYTESNSGDIAENFDEIVNIITETKTINITAEDYESDRIIMLDGFEPNRANINSIFYLKITRDDGTTIINTSDVTKTGDYIQYNSNDGYYYLVLTKVTGKVNVELKYHK